MTRLELEAARMRQWRADHPEKIRESNRLSYQRNREQILARKRAYYQETRKLIDRTETGRLIGRLKKARRRIGGRVTEAEWQSIIAKYDGCCAYCGRSDRPLEMDHAIPISHGGGHVASNIVPACKPCNSSKGNRWWLRG